MEARVAQCLQLARATVTTIDPVQGVAHSIRDYLLSGIDRVWLSDSLHCLITDASIPAWSTEDNGGVLLHNHRCDLTILPLFGYQENLRYGLTAGDTYRYYTCSSSIPPRFQYQNLVSLCHLSTTVNQPYFMKSNEIHRVRWLGPTCDLVYEDLSTVRAEIDVYHLAENEVLPYQECTYQSLTLERYMMRLAQIRGYLEVSK